MLGLEYDASTSPTTWDMRHQSLQGDDGIADDVMPLFWVRFAHRHSRHRLPRIAARLM